MAEPPSAISGRIGRALFNTFASTAGFAAVIIVPARVWDWGRGWIMIGVFLVVHVIGMLRIVRANSDLLRERARLGPHPGRPTADKVLLFAFMVGYSGMLIVSSIDATHGHIWPPPPTAAAWTGLALFAAGWVLVMRALETNAFAIRVVRHQPERGHRVVDVGVYRIVRHPMYAGLCAVMIGAPLWLGSTLGLLCAIVPIAMLMLRILVEERVLKGAVPGYQEYAQRVRKRLLPGVW
ncbi:MAG TPA: isoprenylcysteine carboxylmethyltransferase family protein [Tepidisphaeraceae bacterium]|nr:isoprenylcysteine carboxylmethyltransferase family protein [Tepidisphaeraceae bacterium]